MPDIGSQFSSPAIPNIKHGQEDYGTAGFSIAANNGQGGQVIFNTAFATIPNVVACLWQIDSGGNAQPIIVYVYKITTTGFFYSINNVGTGNQLVRGIQWMAQG